MVVLGGRTGPGPMSGWELFEVGIPCYSFRKRFLDHLRRCWFGNPRWVLTGNP